MESLRNILVVDADPIARKRVVRSLEAGPWRCIESDSAESALRLAQQKAPDLIILELYLPDLSGLGLCRMFRESSDLSRVPLLVVSSQAGEIDRILAFEAGADDFLAKPFYPRELAARVRTIIRGFEASDAAPTGTPALRAVLDDGRLEVEGKRVDLTPIELRIFAELLERTGKVVRRRELIERIWGGDAPLSDRAIDAHVKSIRRKLGDARDCIETVRGVGYRFSESG